MINEAIDKLIQGFDLTLIDTREVFDEILSGLADISSASSFITALKIKNETLDEITGAILSAQESIKKLNAAQDKENLIENIILSKEDNYIDIPLASDIICAANGLGAIRYSFDISKSFKILSLLGVNLKYDDKNISDDFEKTNFSYFYISKNSPYYKYTSQLAHGLGFFNILDITSKMLNPLGAKNQFIGICDKNLADVFCQIALNLGNSNTVVVSGGNDFPYVSISNETKIAEGWKNKIFSYNFSPDLAQIKAACEDEITCESLDNNASDLLEIFQNKQKNAKSDVIILNAGLSLYIAKKAPSLMDGIELAKKTIENGMAFEKLEQIRKINS